MVFSQLFFIYFFLAALLILFYLAKSNRSRRLILIAFSLVFYAWEEPVYVLLMIGLVFADYIFGLFINACITTAAKRIWLVAAIIANLAGLVYFKYTMFFFKTVNTVFSASLPVKSIIMPIGISFFTFQAMSYVIDVYRKDTPVQRNFFKLLLYVSFFPQLIAGPIVRYKDISEQLKDMHVKPRQINDGIVRFSFGLAKKVLIADSCAAAIVKLYSTTDVSFLGRWAGAFFYAFQIYYDFSGYSDMAIGLGKMFGFEFNENFLYPYSSDSATDFWRKWHISLGTFFRDYVYIPLGGNRKHKTRNILIVWFLTGLWHGASWNFVLWGLFYGLLLLFEKNVLFKFLERKSAVFNKIFSRIYVTFITVFGFALFYFTTDTFKSIGYLFGIGVDSFYDIFSGSIFLGYLNLFIVAAVFCFPVVPKIKELLFGRLGLSYEFRRYSSLIIALVLVFLSTVRLVGNTYSPFLYWNF